MPSEHSSHRALRAAIPIVAVLRAMVDTPEVKALAALEDEGPESDVVVQAASDATKPIMERMFEGYSSDQLHEMYHDLELLQEFVEIARSQTVIVGMEQEQEWAKDHAIKTFVEQVKALARNEERKRQKGKGHEL